MKRSLLAREVRAICLLSLATAAVGAHAEADPAVLDTVVVEGDRINVIPTEKLESVFGFGKTAVETPRAVTTISKEMLAAQIATLHNLAFYLRLAGEARMNILAGTFAAWKNEMVPKLERRI